jgi:hypothetical protein
LKQKTLIFLLLSLIILSPFVGYFSFTFLHVGPNNLFSAIVLLTFVLFLLLSMHNGKKIIVPKYLWCYLLFIIYVAISDKILVGKSIGVKYLYSNYKLTAFLVLLLIENTTFSKKEMKVLFRLMLFTVLTAFIVILLQQFYQKDFFVNIELKNVDDYLNLQYSYDIRLPSIYSWISMLEMGFSFIPMLAIIMEYYLLNKVKSKYWSVWFLIGIIYVLLTRDRWEMVNMIALIIIPVIHFKAKLSKVLLNIILIITLMYAGLELSSNFGVPVYGIIENRILEKNNGGLTEGSASTRILAFYVFGQLYPEHPIFGKGNLHTFNSRTDKDYDLDAALGGRSSQIHVGYLSLLYYYGIIGGMLFLLAIYYLMKRLYTRAKLTSWWSPFFGILGFVLANFTLVDFSLFHAGLIMALVFDKYFVGETLVSQTKLPQTSPRKHQHIL